MYNVHHIKRFRVRFGEYHHLFAGLRRDATRFFEYIRMSTEFFDFILSKIRHLLEKRVGLQQQVNPEKKLVVTLR